MCRICVRYTLDVTKALARDQSASLEDWQKLARTGEIVWFYNGRNRKKTGKMLRYGHFEQAVSESWLKPLPIKQIAQGSTRFDDCESRAGDV